MKTKISLLSGILTVACFLVFKTGNADTLWSSSLLGSNPVPALFADTTYLMDFETISDFSLTFGNWTVNDVDQHTTYGIADHTFPHQMEAMAFLCFNPSQVVPSMASDPNIQPRSGQRFGACFSSNPPSNNDWFISPRIQLGTNGVFSFWIKSYSDFYGLDKYQALVSVTGNDPSSFSPLSGPDSLQTTVTWTKKSFNLSKFDNQKVYVAIRCVSKDNYLMMIDDLEVRTTSSSVLIADFMADKTSVKVGEGVNFTDLSVGSPTSWAWSFPGGTPAASATQNPPNIKYSSPGSYPVTLIVSNGVVSDTMTKNPYITVTGYPSGAYLDFESLEDFTLVFEPWTTVDAGGGITYGINGISYPHQYAPMAYICFVPSNTSPALTNMAPHSGQKLGCCFSSEPPSTPNNKWLISPKLTLGNNAQVEFWVQSYNSSYGDERYNIAVSTTDLNPSSFLSLVPSPEIAPSAWTKKSYSLSSYANQTVYIGIQCVTDNGFIFMIDDIAIGSSLGIHEPAKRDPLNIYPNPARDRITLNLGSNSTGSFSVELLNLYGETTRMWKEMGNQPSVTLNIGGISPGIYIVRLHTTDREINRKIMILN